MNNENRDGGDTNRAMSATRCYFLMTESRSTVSSNEELRSEVAMSINKHVCKSNWSTFNYQADRTLHRITLKMTLAIIPHFICSKLSVLWNEIIKLLKSITTEARHYILHFQRANVPERELISEIKFHLNNSSFNDYNHSHLSSLNKASNIHTGTISDDTQLQY